MASGLTAGHNEQLELFELVSPCIGICQSDARGYCLGCLRSRQERFDWHKMDNSQRQEVLRLCRDRARRKRHATQSKPSSRPEQLTLTALDEPQAPAPQEP